MATITIRGSTKPKINIKNDSNKAKINISNNGNGGGGTKDHAKLVNLDYEHSGHTGFASALELIAEAKARKDNDDYLQELLTQETNNRVSADNNLQSQINTEIQAREGGDNTLQTQLDNIQTIPESDVEELFN